MIKTSKQLKDLIRNLSKKKSADAQIFLFIGWILSVSWLKSERIPKQQKDAENKIQFQITNI